jgi:uncharacterized protein YraI
MRLLLCFLVLAGLLYAGHALFFAGGDNSADPAAEPASGQAEPSQALAFEALTPSPEGSRHAIAVEQALVPSPGEMSTASTESAPPANSVNDQPAFMKVTAPASIREGPSTSATIVGIAQPGAEAQIVSRSTDWVEIIDPASKKTGWIHQSFLAPQEEPAARPVPPEELAALATPESESAADDQMPSITSKPRKHASRHRHRRHTIVLGPFILRFR